MAAERSEVERIQVRDANGDMQHIQLECNWDVGIGGSLWTSGRLLVDYLSRHAQVRDSLGGTTVLELGSGTGLVGLAMSLMGPSRVILTDLESHVQALERNVALNSQLIPSNTSVEACALDWNTFTAAEATRMKRVDWIVGTDIAYQTEFYVPLLKTLELLADADTRILLGLGRHDTDMRFFRMLEDAGYEYYKIPDEQVAAEFRGKDFGLFDIQKRKD